MAYKMKHDVFHLRQVVTMVAVLLQCEPSNKEVKAKYQGESLRGKDREERENEGGRERNERKATPQ